jgi:hypothetical protein
MTHLPFPGSNNLLFVLTSVICLSKTLWMYRVGCDTYDPTIEPIVAYLVPHHQGVERGRLQPLRSFMRIHWVPEYTAIFRRAGHLGSSGVRRHRSSEDHLKLHS